MIHRDVKACLIHFDVKSIWNELYIAAWLGLTWLGSAWHGTKYALAHKHTDKCNMVWHDVVVVCACLILELLSVGSLTNYEFKRSEEVRDRASERLWLHCISRYPPHHPFYTWFSFYRVVTPPPSTFLSEHEQHAVTEREVREKTRARFIFNIFYRYCNVRANAWQVPIVFHWLVLFSFFVMEVFVCFVLYWTEKCMEQWTTTTTASEWKMASNFKFHINHIFFHRRWIIYSRAFEREIPRAQKANLPATSWRLVQEAVDSLYRRFIYDSIVSANDLCCKFLCSCVCVYNRF